MDKYSNDPAVRKQQKRRKLHVLKLHVTVGEADFDRIVEKGRQFLSKQEQVRFIVQLRGRERSRPVLGVDMLNSVVEALSDSGSPQNEPSAVNLQVTFNPKKR